MRCRSTFRESLRFLLTVPFAIRTFWTGMLVLHVGAIRSVWLGLHTPGAEGDTVAGAVRVATLGLSVVFFLLKIADVRWLRLKPGWRSTVSAIVVVAVLHISVLDRASRREIYYSPAHLGFVLCIGTLLEVEGLRRMLRRTPPWIDRVLNAGRREHSVTPAYSCTAWEDARKPDSLKVIRRDRPPRAPPVF